jgi:hypothetical protein
MWARVAGLLVGGVGFEGVVKMQMVRVCEGEGNTASPESER